ncbi:MAG: hypothetical protein HZB95_08240 [Nitrosomonadales bacterium]|nr:hypothetical protein [Nitrosomonadales bacterium]
MRILFLAALIFTVLNVSAGSLPVVSISDPAGDDFGDGTLRYPQREDFKTGDLDLLQLQISRDEQGFWFEAVLKNPIRDPAAVHATVGGDSLADSARKGFYQFNIDVYIDTDRAEGSGNTFTLPGRKVRIDADFAWERAVILTPRPELMRQQLIGVLLEQYPEKSTAEIEASVDQSLFFPTRIKVRGKTIAFFVPAGFFGGSAGSNWAATALVTGAITTVSADFSLFPSTKKPLDILLLGVMQPALGHPRDSFGYSERQPSPVVDVLGASSEQQIQQLADKEDLSGVSWGSADAADKTQAATASVTPIARLLQPQTTLAITPAGSGAAEERSTVDGAIARRLQSLQQLYDQKLIDETEYKQQKQRILNEL